MKDRATFCHHCGKQIVWNQTYPDKSHSHWAHAILVFNGKAHSLENALMDQRCTDGRNWATPARNTTKSLARLMTADDFGQFD